MKMISASVVALAIASTLLSMSVPLAARLNKEFVVGGDQHWRFGYNYSDWALRNFPFIDDDILGTFSQRKLFGNEFVPNNS